MKQMLCYYHVLYTSNSSMTCYGINSFKYIIIYILQAFSTLIFGLDAKFPQQHVLHLDYTRLKHLHIHKCNISNYQEFKIDDLNIPHPHYKYFPIDRCHINIRKFDQLNSFRRMERCSKCLRCHLVVRGHPYLHLSGHITIACL